jgi:hypothetical protein
MEKPKLTVEDIRYKSSFEYNGKHWRATGEYTYEWQDGRWSREFEISRSGAVRFLEIEDQEEKQRILVFKKENPPVFDKKITTWESTGAPNTVRFRGKTYEFKEFASAIWDDRRAAAGEEETVKVWDFYATDGEIFSAELWEEGEIECYVGREVSPNAFKNITPGEQPSRFGAGGLSEVPEGCWFPLLFLAFIFMVNIFQCGGSSSSDYEYPTNRGRDFSQIVREFDAHNEFSLILRDMDYKNSQHYHKYEYVTDTSDVIVSSETGWYEVTPTFFKQHVNHLGLQLLHKNGGTKSFGVDPPGFSQFVGNEKYGSWKDNYGEYEWHYSPEYENLNAILTDGFAVPIKKNYENWKNPSGTNKLPSDYNTAFYMISDRGARSNWGMMTDAQRRQAIEETTRRSSGGRYYRTGNRNSRTGIRSGGGGK